MTTPTYLSGATCTLKIDGVDLHSMGMLVTNISNPSPQARESCFQIPGRDSDFDFTKRYGTRVMTISGNIVGNSSSNLKTHIDELKAYFRLKKNAGTFQVIFQNQTDRYWTCRFQSFDVAAVANWFLDHTAVFTLVLKCVKPYAEATSMTSENILLHCLQNKKITYAGTVSAPLNIEISPRYYPNILEYQNFGINEDYTKWDYTNASGSDYTINKIFGANSTKVSQTAGGAYDCHKAITLGASSLIQIDVTQNYVFGAYMVGTGIPNTSALKVTTNLATYSSSFSPGLNMWHFTYIKLTAAQMVGVISVTMSIENAGENAHIYIDGCFIYHITAAEAADTSYVPPPYNGEDTNPGGTYWKPPKNPIIKLHASKNIFPLENGDYDATEWALDTDSISAFDDPFGGEDRTFLIRDNTVLDKGDTGSPPFYLTGNKYYKISFDYYFDVPEGHACGAFVGIDQYVGSGNIGVGAEILLIYAKTNTWTTRQFELQTYKSTEYGKLIFGITNGKFYIKNIMIVEEAAQGEAFDSYVKPNISSVAYTGTINGTDHNDSLIINSDRMTADYLNGTTLANSNGMASLVLDPLYLEPGSNIVRYQDSRFGDSAPELESCGAVQAKLNYRARYL
jgi:predicted phage tail component-like protein